MAALLLATNGPAWITPVDSRTVSQWLAESPGRIYGVRDGNLVALDAATGRLAWRSLLPANGAPAYLNGSVALPIDGALALLDAATGRVRRIIAAPGYTSVAATKNALVAAAYGNVDGTLVRGLDSTGQTLWKRTLRASSNIVVFPLGGDASALFDHQYNTMLVLDARNGKAVAQATDVDDLVGADGRYLWFTVLEGGIKGLDLNTNRSIALHGSVIMGAVTVERGIAVSIVDGRIRATDLRAGRALPLHIYGRWIGGPIAGKILVERGDGLYVQPLNALARAVRVAKYSAESRFVTTNKSTAFVGLLDGTIQVIDMARARRTAAVRTPCRFYEGFTAVGGMTIVHCDDEAKRSQLVAFRT